MRDIKFRVWDTDYEKMTYFDDEEYEYKPPLVFRLDQVFKKDSNYDDYEDFEYNDVTDSVEVMQYIGLKDKNGKEIYEGDIVSFNLKSDSEGQPNITGYIEYQTTFSGYRIMSFKGSFALDYNIKDIEVIGNIYDNPNLLEEGE